MADVKELLIELQLQNDQLIKAVEDTKTRMGGLEKKQTALQKGTAKLKAGYVLVAGVLTGILARGLGGLIRKASDAQETLSKFNTVFRDIQKDANAVAKNLSRNFGLSAIKARDLLAGTGDLLVGFGFTQESALDLSKQVQELAVDLTSFTNFAGGAEGASEALTKALLGEREMVKSLGISILETDVKTKMLENSQKGLTFESERQAKAYATLQIAQEQSQLAQGDFARTSHQFAGQVRILTANIENWVVNISSRLLPVFAPLISALNSVLTPAKNIEDITQDLIKSQTKYTEVLNKLTESETELTKSEREDLLARKELLELDILKQIDELNKSYDNQTKTIGRLNRENERSSTALESLREKLTSTKDTTVELTEAEANLIGQTTIQARGFATITENTFHRISALNKLTTAQATAKNTTVELNQENERLSTAVRTLAQALAEGRITEQQLLGLREGLLDQIRERVKLIPGEIDAERKIAEAREKEDQRRARVQRAEAERQARIKAERQERTRLEKEARKLDLDEFINITNAKTEKLREAIEEEKALRTELNEFKKISEQEIEAEEESAHQRKIDRINELLELERISNEERIQLTRARTNLEVLMEEEKAKRQLSAAKTALSNIASLSSENNKFLFALGKTAAVSSSIINTAEAVTKVLAQGGIFGPALAIPVGIAGAAQTTKILAQEPPVIPGRQQGGVIDRVAPGNIPGEDGIIGARIGEGILNVQATAELGRDAIDALNAGQGIGEPNILIVQVADKAEGEAVVNDYLRKYGTSEQGVSL